MLIFGVPVMVGLVSVLFVSVWVSVVPTTVPDGAVLPAQVSRSASQAWTLVPMTKPRLVLALAAVEAPVPPSAIAKSVMPVIVPAEIFAVAIVAVGITTVPVKVGLAESALVAIAV